MFEKIRNEVFVGAVVLLALVILGYYTVIMGRREFDTGGIYNLVVYFTDVGGLEKSAKVSVNGVHLGTVQELDLMDSGVRVTLRLNRSFTLYENYRILIRSEAALGGKSVSIYPGGGINPAGESYRPLEDLDDLRGELDDPLLAISRLIEENRSNVSTTMRNLKDITEKINSGQGTVGKLLNDKKLHDDAGNLFRQASEVIEDAREQAPITSFIRAALTAF